MTLDTSSFLMSKPLLEIRDLRVERPGPDGLEPVVSSFRLDVAPGETVGIVGESGSGKSMTARAIMGLLPPGLVASGSVKYRGREVLGLGERDLRRIRGREIGMILQDPFMMLNPVFRCGRTIEESLVRVDRSGRRLSRAERQAEVRRRLGEVGLRDETVVERYPFQLSGGMRQRVAIAAALARDPEVLIADEPTTALDVTTQQETLALLRTVQRSRGMGLIMITHDLRVAFAMCDRIYVMYAGSLIEVSPARALEDEPLHPYTQGLLLSEPSIEHRVAELASIQGSVPAAASVQHSCPFADRCAWVQDSCRDGQPPLVEIVPGRSSACIRMPLLLEEMRAERTAVERVPAPPLEPNHGGGFVEVNELRKVFNKGPREVVALSGVSIEVGANESVALVGESGSGKSTLARSLVGLERPTSGEIFIDGVPAADWSSLSRVDRRRLQGDIQMVFQDPYASLNPMRTIGSVIAEAVTVDGRRRTHVRERVAELLQTVGLPPGYAARKPSALSGGERQRVAIARALAVEPRMLVCDEPVSALDMSVRAQILNLFAELRREHGIGYLFITHDLSMLRQVADRAYVMHRGRIVESGPVAQILENPRDPYTVKLLGSIPRSDSDWMEKSAAGEPGS